MISPVAQGEIVGDDKVWLSKDIGDGWGQGYEHLDDLSVFLHLSDIKKS